METQTAGRRGNHKKTFFSRQKEGILVSFAIQLFTIPLVAYSYYEIPVYAMLINLFVLAVVNGLLGLTVLGVIVGMAFLPRGVFCLRPVAGCSTVTGFCVRFP